MNRVNSSRQFLIIMSHCMHDCQKSLLTITGHLPSINQHQYRNHHLTIVGNIWLTITSMSGQLFTSNHQRFSAPPSTSHTTTLERHQPNHQRSTIEKIIHQPVVHHGTHYHNWLRVGSPPRHENTPVFKRGKLQHMLIKPPASCSPWGTSISGWWFKTPASCLKPIETSCCLTIMVGNYSQPDNEPP